METVHAQSADSDRHSSTSALSDNLDKAYAPAWKPEAGGKLVGTVTDLSEREGYDGDPYPIVTVRTDDGTELAFHGFHTVAQNELAKLRPQVGDQIGIKYLGLVQGANSRSKYHGYRVRTVGSTTSGVNWARYGDGNEPAPAPDAPIDASDFDQAAQAAKEVGDNDDLPF